MVSRRVVRGLVVAGVLLAMLTPVAIEFGLIPLVGESLWSLPAIAVAVLAYVRGWRGALAIILANSLIFIAIEIWPLNAVIHDEPTALSDALPLLVVRLIVSFVVAWATIRFSMAEQLRRLNELHVHSEEQARLALEASEARFRRLVEQIPAVVYTVGLVGAPAPTYISPRIEQLVGYPLSAFAETPNLLDRVTHPDDLARKLAAFEAANASFSPLSIDYRLTHRDGRTIWVRDESDVVSGSDGVPLYAQGVLIDITERMQADASLRESEERFRGAFDDAGSPMAMTAMDGRFMRVNAAMCAMLGYTNEELLARTFPAVTVAEDLGRQVELANQILSGERSSYQLEKRYIHKDGRHVHAIVTASAIYDPDGRPEYTVVHIQDITARMQAEEALRENEERLRAAFDDAGSGASITDLNGYFLRVNQAMCSLLGYTEEELVGRHFRDITFLEDQNPQATQGDRVAAGDIASFQMEKRYLHKDGSIIFGTVTVSAIRGLDGRPAAIVSHVQDITAQKQAEAALRQREQEFKALAENAPDIIIRYDRAYRLTYANPLAATVLDRPAADLVGKSVAEISTSPERERFWVERISTVLETGRQVEVEYDAGPDEQRLWFHARLVPELAEDGSVESVLLVSHDITARKASETALRESEERFRAAIEGSMDAFHILRSVRDARGTIIDFDLIDMNARGAEFLNVRREEVLGMRVRTLFPHYYRSGFFETYVRVVESGRPIEEEFPDPTPGFAGAWLRHQIVPLADGLAITSRDITEERRAAEAMRESEDRYRAAAHGSMDAFYVARAVRDPAGAVVDFEIVDMNSRAEEFLRLTRLLAIGRAVSSFFPAYKETGFFDKYVQVMESGEPFEEELPDPTPGFEGAWMHHQIVPLTDGVAITSRDITSRMEIENALRESEERFRSAFAYAVTGMARVTPDGRFLEVNPAFLATFGFSEDELRGRTLADLVHPDDRPALAEQLQHLTAGEVQAVQVEGRYFNHQTHMLWGLLGASAIHDGASLYFICQIQDITARKEQEQRLLRQAQHDSLTSLPNRLLFMERLERALENAARRGEAIAVMYLDLDGFKLVNDTLGHQVGDQLLAEVGTRLARCIRSGDTVARLGGDEFAIIAEGVLSQETATRLAGRVIEEFERPFNVGGAAVDVGVSIGIAFSAVGHANPDYLLHEADVALYQAKAAGKRRYLIYSRDLTPEQEDQLLAERTADWSAPTGERER